MQQTAFIILLNNTIQQQYYYMAGLILTGRITGLVRPSVRPSVCRSVYLVRAPNSRFEKGVEKKLKIGVDVFHARND